MFSSKDKSDVHYDTLISAKTEIQGDVKLTGGLHIDGVIKGNLIAEVGSGATVRVSEKGRVEGQITAPNIIINGEVMGDVHASEYIELAKKARVNGDVYYTAMEMVLGAQVNGQLHHSQDKASAPAKSPTVQKTEPDTDSKVD